MALHQLQSDDEGTPVTDTDTNIDGGSVAPLSIIFYNMHGTTKAHILFET